jgi:hypothetical protein
MQASLDRRKTAVLFARECIVLTNATSSDPSSLLYLECFFLFAQVQVHQKAFALHTSGNSDGYFHSTSYHSFVLTFSLSGIHYLFRQKINMKQGIQNRQIQTKKT